MIKNLIEQLDYGFYAECSLVLFTIIFLVVAARTFLTRGEVTRRQSMIVMNDEGQEDNS